MSPFVQLRRHKFRIGGEYSSYQSSQYISEAHRLKVRVNNTSCIVSQQLQNDHTKRVYRGESGRAVADAMHPSEECERRHGRISPHNQILDKFLYNTHDALLNEREFSNDCHDRLGRKLARQILPVHREGYGAKRFGVPASNRRGHLACKAIALVRQVRSQDLFRVEITQSQADPYGTELPSRINARR